MPAEMNEDETKFIEKFISVLEDFTKHRPNMPVHHVEMLLKLALDEGKSQKYYSINWKTPPATVSRIMLDFGKRFRKGEAGMGLIDERVSDHSLREHEVYLSDKGSALLRKVIRKLRE